jgi:hypothetical protein
MSTPRTTPVHVDSHDDDSRLARLARRVPRPLSRRLALDAHNTRLRGEVGVRNAWVR